VISLKPDGIFDIPVQFEATADSFDISIKHVESWVAELPMADVKKSARELSDKLDEINRIEMPNRHRLKILELLVPTVGKTTLTLKQHYITQGMPLSDKGHDSARLAQELNDLFATGYKIIFEQSWKLSISILKRKTMALVTYRAVFFLCETLMNAYEAYRDPPPYFWQQIHQLYQYACQKRLENVTLNRTTSSEQAHTKCIENLYKKILLIGLISPYRLRQNITNKVYAILDSWNEHTDIVPFERNVDRQYLALIDLHSDSAPSFPRTELPTDETYSNYLMIDTSGLIMHLNEITLQRNNTRSFSDLAADIPYNALKTLLITWSGSTKRAFSRAKTQYTIGVSIGLSATHYFIHELDKHGTHSPGSLCKSAKSKVWNNYPAENKSHSHADPQLEAPANFINTSNFLTDNTIIEQNFSDSGMNAKYTNNTYSFLEYKQAQTQNEESQQNRPSHYNNVNESAGGLCLIGNIRRSDQTNKVRIGELVSLFGSSDSSDEILTLGVVRRVQCSDDEIKLGIQKLAPCAEAIASCTFQPNRKLEQYSRSLVLPEFKSINQAVTLVTHKMHSVDDRLILNKGGYKTVVKLTRLVESTDVFSQFEFSVSHVLGYEEKTDMELELEQPKQNSKWSLL